MSIRRQFTVATVADLYLSNPQDDDVYTTRGYSQEGVGGNAYRYDASSVAAVDYGYVLDGRGGNGSGTGTGRFLAVSLNEIRATQFGVLPSGDSTVAFGRAVDAAMARGLPLLVDLPSVSLATWVAKATTASLTIRSTYSTSATLTGPGGAVDLLTLTSGHAAVVDHVRFSGFRYIANQSGANLATVDPHVSVKDYGAVGNGVTDDGPAIRLAIATGRPVFIPSGTYIVDFDPASAFTDGGNTRYAYSINIPSNTVLICESGSVIKQKAGAQSWNRVVVMNGVSNVKVFGELKIDGNVSGIGATTNEHMHGLFIFDCTNIYIQRVDSQNCRGDNVFIGGTDEDTFSSQIQIDSMRCISAGRKNLVLQQFDNVRIGDAYLDNSAGGAALFSGTPDDTDKHCLDVEPDSFTGAHWHRASIGSLTTKGTGSDFTSGVTVAAAEKCVIDIDKWDHQHTSSTVKTLINYGATLNVGRACFTGIAGAAETFSIWYGARFNVRHMTVIGSTPAVADPMFLIAQVGGARPRVRIDHLELTNTVGAGIENRDADVSIGKYVPQTAGIVGWARGLWTADQVVADQAAMLSLTGLTVGYVVIQSDDIATSASTVWTFNGPVGTESTLANWSASNGVYTEYRVDSLDMENVGAPAGAGYAFYISKDGSLQPVVNIGHTSFRDSRTPKLNYIYLVGSGAAAQVSLGTIANQTAVANISYVGSDKFRKSAGGGPGPCVFVCTGTPESMIAAPVGSLAVRDNGGAGTTLYVKESGTGNTGWVAK